jgi:Raf kinase inhibitor-like YbhB/YbcL family protein
VRLRSLLAVLVAACASLGLVATAIAKHGSPVRHLRLQVGGLDHGQRFGIDQVYDQLGCHGGNMSPQLLISGVPKAAESLAITIFDPDAPTQSGWWHWLVYDLPPGTTQLREDASKTGLPGDQEHHPAQGPNDFGFGSNVYGGVCPPAGSPPHHYRVTVWALKVTSLVPLGAKPGASTALIDYLIEANAIAHRTVTVRYGR